MDKKDFRRESRMHAHVHAEQKEKGGSSSNVIDSGSSMPTVNSHSNESSVTVPLNSEGYLQVAKMNDTAKMESFMLRVIDQLGLRVQDRGGFLGVLPYYDGTKSTQTFEKMKEEMKHQSDTKKGWLTLQAGASAPLNEAGYSRVAKLNNSREMTSFVRRVVADLGLCIDDEGRLAGVSPWYSGEKDTQSYARLRAEVINASKYTGAWVVTRPCKQRGPDVALVDFNGILPEDTAMQFHKAAKGRKSRDKYGQGV
jgi:hypothetical protein